MFSQLIWLLYPHIHRSLHGNISSSFIPKCHKTGSNQLLSRVFSFHNAYLKKVILKMFTFISVIQIFFCFCLHVDLMYFKSRNSFNKKLLMNSKIDSTQIYTNDHPTTARSFRQSTLYSCYSWSAQPVFWLYFLKYTPSLIFHFFFSTGPYTNDWWLPASLYFGHHTDWLEAAVAGRGNSIEYFSYHHWKLYTVCSPWKSDSKSIFF